MADLYFGKAPRLIEVIAGLFLGVFGGFFVVTAAAAAFALATGQERRSLMLFGSMAALAVAGLCLPLAWKLIRGAGRSRSDALLSPLGLRIGSLLFIGPPLLAMHGGTVSVWAVLESLALATACWVLAARRQRQLEDTPDGFAGLNGRGDS